MVINKSRKSNVNDEDSDEDAGDGEDVKNELVEKADALKRKHASPRSQPPQPKSRKRPAKVRFAYVLSIRVLTSTYRSRKPRPNVSRAPPLPRLPPRQLLQSAKKPRGGGAPNAAAARPAAAAAMPPAAAAPRCTSAVGHKARPPSGPSAGPAAVRSIHL